MILFMTDEFEYPSPLAESKASNFHAILWYVEMTFTLLELISHIRIATASGGYKMLDLDIIDQFELREFTYLIS